MSVAVSHFDELNATFALRPIRSGKAYRHAMKMMVSIAHEQDSDARDYKTVLGKLIEDFEREVGHRVNTSNVTAADVVRHLLEERDMTVNAFAREIGVSQGTLNEILRGKRQWSKSIILKVADYFGLATDLFLRR